MCSTLQCTIHEGSWSDVTRFKSKSITADLAGRNLGEVSYIAVL